MKTKNQRRPYLSISFDVQNERLCLSNYGSVPAQLNEVYFPPNDLDKIKATDNLASLISGKGADKPFKDLEGTIIGPGLDYCFCIDTNADVIKNDPYITVTLKYGAAKHSERSESPYNEPFKINLCPKTGYMTALYIQGKRQTT